MKKLEGWYGFIDIDGPLIASRREYVKALFEALEYYDQQLFVSIVNGDLRLGHKGLGKLLLDDGGAVKKFLTGVLSGKLINYHHCDIQEGSEEATNVLYDDGLVMYGVTANSTYNVRKPISISKLNEFISDICSVHDSRESKKDIMLKIIRNLDININKIFSLGDDVSDATSLIELNRELNTNIPFIFYGGGYTAEQYFLEKLTLYINDNGYNLEDTMSNIHLVEDWKDATEKIYSIAN